MEPLFAIVAITMLLPTTKAAFVELTVSDIPNWFPTPVTDYINAHLSNYEQTFEFLGVPWVAPQVAHFNRQVDPHLPNTYENNLRFHLSELRFYGPSSFEVKIDEYPNGLKSVRFRIFFASRRTHNTLILEVPLFQRSSADDELDLELQRVGLQEPIHRFTLEGAIDSRYMEFDFLVLAQLLTAGVIQSPTPTDTPYAENHNTITYSTRPILVKKRYLKACENLVFHYNSSPDEGQGSNLPYYDFNIDPTFNQNNL